MKIPVQISTRKLSLSSIAMDVIKTKAKKLEKFYDKIIACRIMVEAPHRHKTQGLLYNVSIDISVPGAELAVKREAHEDVYVAIRDAFDSARRQLLHHRSRRKNKKHLAQSKDHSVTHSSPHVDRALEESFLRNFDVIDVIKV